MKFFNWVQKRFHHPLPKDDFAQKLEKSTTEEVLHTNDKDTQALLKKVVLIDALDGWKDGILAIGTFGFDPLKPFIQQKEYLVLESEEDDEESPEYSFEGSDSDDNDEYSDDTTVEDEEMNPLMLSTLGHNFKDVGKDDFLVSFDGVSLASREVAAAQENTISMQSDDQEKKKVGRTTLADLFLADADVKMKLDSSKVLPDASAKKMNVKTKKSLSFAKKFIPKVKEETSPIKNIQRVMKRMLKRKIHPELLDVNTPKSDGQKAAGAIELIGNGPMKAASESVSLLAMQGATSEL